MMVGIGGVSSLISCSSSRKKDVDGIVGDEAVVVDDGCGGEDGEHDGYESEFNLDVDVEAVDAVVRSTSS